MLQIVFCFVFFYLSLDFHSPLSALSLGSPTLWFFAHRSLPYGLDERGKESKLAVTIVSSFLFRSFHHWHDGRPG